MATQQAAQVLLDQARLQLTDQMVRLDNFRSKSFAALAVSGTVAAFFGGRIASTPYGLKITGICVFGATALLSVVIAWPMQLFHGVQLRETRDWLSNYGDHEEAATLMTQSAARAVVDSIIKNEGKVGRASLLFGVQCVTLAAQLGIWLAILAHV